jgi:hypothetical protein
MHTALVLLPQLTSETRTLYLLMDHMPIPLAARSLAGIAGSNPAGGMDVCFL